MPTFNAARRFRSGTLLRWAVLVGAALGCAGGCSAAPANRAGGELDSAATARAASAARRAAPLDLNALPQPRPEYKPYQVVQIVMDALQNNDASNTGIAIAFNFASPANRQATGPLERFISLVQRPVYGPLLNCQDVACGTATVEGDHAAGIVAVLDAVGSPAFYLVQLSRQTEGKYQGCWMTDGVLRIEVELGPGALGPRGVVRI